MNHPTNAQLVGYRERTLGAADLIAVGDHLASCEACRAADPNSDARRVALVASLVDAVPEHPAPELLTAFALDRLEPDATADVEAHLDRCDLCSEVIQEVTAHREVTLRSTQTTRQAASWIYPLAAAAAVTIVIGASLWWTRSSNNPAESRLAESRPVSPPVATIADGSRSIVLTNTGEITGFDAIGLDQRAMLAAALTSKSLTLPASLADVRAEQGHLLGGPTDDVPASLVSPIGTYVTDSRPAFEWMPARATDAVKVEVYGPGYALVAESGWLTTNQWKPSADLAAGQRYSWQLTVRTARGEVSVPKPPAPQARFATLSGAVRVKLDEDLRAAGDSRLLRAVILARAGAVDLAETELKALKVANPDSIEITAFLTQLRPIPAR